MSKGIVKTKILKPVQRASELIHRLFSSRPDEQLKKNILQAVPFLIASTVTGIVAVFYAKFFSWAEELNLYIFNNSFPWLYVISPLCFILSWYLVKKLAPPSKGSGIPQVMAAIELSSNKTTKHLVQKLLGLRIILVKVFSSIVMVLGGGAVGREGPTIQIAASVFTMTNKIVPKWWPKVSGRKIITAGSAAGLAAAFNTPLGGIVFALEELSKTHMGFIKTVTFTAVIIAGLTAQGLAGTYLYLGYPVIGSLSWWLFLGVALTSVIAGLLGSILSKLILWVIKWKSNFKSDFKNVIFLVVCSLALVTLAGFVSDIILGSGKRVMETTLFTDNKYTEWYVPLLRMFGPLISFTSGGAGGIFAPALSAGAGVGSTLSGWFQLSPSDTNIMILGGMVAFLTGMTRSPFTSAVLVLEMTDRHSIIFHLILAGLISSLVSMLVDKEGLYDHLKQEYLVEKTKEENTDTDSLQAN